MDIFLEISDMDVICRVLNGDKYAYDIIVQRYQRLLFSVAHRILNNDSDAQDAVQEAYVQIFLNLDKFSAPGNFAAWVTRITINEALKLKRKYRRFVNLDAAHLEPLPVALDTHTPRQVNPETELTRKQVLSLVRSAVRKLPRPLRLVFLLRAIIQLNVKETAEFLDIPESTVKTRFHRARSLMQQELDCDPEDDSPWVIDSDTEVESPVVENLFSFSTHPPRRDD